MNGRARRKVPQPIERSDAARVERSIRELNWLWVAVLLAVCLPSLARADLPSIRFDRLRPLGASAGSTVEAEISGAEIDGVDSLLFDHPGFKASPIEGKDRWFKITVDPGVPPGTYDVRLVGRWGVSNPRLFAVSRGLTDVAEKEPNNDPASAQRVDVNSAVNGDADGNGQDVFRFSARRGQRVVIDCQAGKLDSMMDATMSLATADGKLLAANSDYNGRDPLIDFLAPHDGEFLITLHDLSYRGGFPYRLILTDLPRVENVFPAPRRPASRSNGQSWGATCRTPLLRRSRWTACRWTRRRFHACRPPTCSRWAPFVLSSILLITASCRRRRPAR